MDSPWTLQHRGEQADPDDLLWTRGLTVDPAAAWAFRPVDDIVAQSFSNVNDTDDVITGTAFTDGSLQNKHRLGGQAGWSAVELNAEATRARIAYYGPLPVSLPVQRRILRAEL